jgi:hypothetical protein
MLRLRPFSIYIFICIINLLLKKTKKRGPVIFRMMNTVNVLGWVKFHSLGEVFHQYQCLSKAETDTGA